MQRYDYFLNYARHFPILTKIYTSVKEKLKGKKGLVVWGKCATFAVGIRRIQFEHPVATVSKIIYYTIIYKTHDLKPF